jgi:hypothetical protein
MELNENGKVWVLVETIQTFRHRYMVEAPLHNPEWALDTVTMEEAKEFSQEWLGETIVSHRIVSEREALNLCDKDNSYLKDWTDEQKKKAFFTHEGENQKDEFAPELHSDYYYDTDRNK